ncbi:MAG: DUF4331 family protein [Flavobacteriales bacterium]|nr:DUF4331 family protein [Flavobacteriales bacterium]
MKQLKNLALASGLLFALGANASSHREAPLIANDPLADNTDVYAFRSPDNPNTITIIANYVPMQLPHGGPNYYSFGENIRYEVHIDNDVTTAGDDIVYRFTFNKVNQDPTTFFNVRLGQQNLKTTYTLERSIDGGATFQTVIVNGVVPVNNIGPRSIEGGAGLGSTYAALMANAVTMASTGEKVFAGPVEDPFFVDLAGIFDLGDAPRQMGTPKDGLACLNVSSIVIQVDISTLQKDGLNVSQAANILDPAFVVGIWASASRPQMRTLTTTGTVNTSGNWVQVSRLGMPLTNEAVIPIGSKDLWNSLTPYQDLANIATFGNYFYNPELALYMDDSQFGGAVPAFSPLRIQRNSLQAFDFGNGQSGLWPLKGSAAVAGTALDDAIFGTLLLPADNSPRSVDLWPIFHTGVPNLAPYQLATGKGGNPLAAGKPFINNFLPNGGDMLRLNMATPVTQRNDPAFSSLGIVAAAVAGLTDPAYNTSTALQFIPNMDGFPNGRRLEDDVTRIELQAVGGVALAAIGLWYDDYTAGGPNPVTQDLLDVLTYSTGIDANDVAFQTSFPYEAMPFSGAGECSGLAIAYTQPVVLPPSNGAPCTEDLTLTINTDDFGSETTWEIRRTADNSVTASGGPYVDTPGGTVEVESICLPVDCYDLIVNDGGGNGIDGGGFILTDDMGNRIIDANGDFGSSSTSPNEWCLPIGGTFVKANWCDRTDLVRNDFIYCQGVAGASGYQFWFFDPHGSYSRRILKPTTSCRLNFQTSPLPLNTDLNVRVRALIGGNYQEFGKACRINVVGGVRSVEFDTDAAHLSMYPNPNRGDALYLVIENLSEEATTAQVEIFDGMGKKVLSQQVAMGGGTLNTALSLGGDFGTGMYLVNVRVDGELFTERLIRE